VHIKKRKPIRMTANFSIETIKSRRAWNNVLLALKESSCKPRLLHGAKLLFIIEGKKNLP
jgi:hypothetical protein